MYIWLTRCQKIVSRPSRAGDEHEDSDESICETQSGMELPGVMSVEVADGNLTSQITTFDDANPSLKTIIENEPDMSFGVADTGDVSLEEFFARPIRIREYNWTVNSPLFENFNPWTDFWTNKRNINRINNFSLLRCKMHVKVVINGNGFYFGRILASYNPMPLKDDFTFNRSFESRDIVAASQRPHFYVDPTTGQGGEMELPFFFYKNALNIFEGDWTQMGTMNMRTLTNLAHANGGTDPLTITVYAWATEVKLAAPTTVEAASLVPQSGMEGNDEYSSNPVSAPATAIAQVAGRLKQMPAIGPYAKATEIACGAMAAIAKAFGYSRPAEISPIESYKPIYVGNMANTNVPDTCQKLSLDAKQEITVDPRVTGLGSKDELNIVDMAMRESFIRGAQWSPANAVNQRLFNVRVTPMQWLRGGTIPQEYHMTPSCLAALPFRYWRGSFKFRCQVVASNFHKGRLRIVYDPLALNSNLNADTEDNLAYSYIIDIAKTRDFTVKIGWANDKPYCEVLAPEDGQSENSGGVAFTTVDSTTTNGMIGVYVLNQLSGPSSSSQSVALNFFCSMCDDFEVGGPTTSLNNYTWFSNTAPAAAQLPSGSKPSIEDKLEPQSGIESETDADGTPMPAMPESTTMDVVKAPTLSPTDQLNLICLGESAVSFRQLLKRYNYFASTFLRGGTQTVFALRRMDIPYLRGFAPGAVDQAFYSNGTTLGPYNRCQMTLLNLLLPCFAGYRGALRWKYAIGMAGGIEDSSKFGLKGIRIPAGTYLDTEAAIDNTGTQSIARGSIDNIKESTASGAIAQTSANSVLEFECPYYSNLRFKTARENNFTSDVASEASAHVLEYTVSADSAFRGTEIESYVSVGEDFNLYFFTGVPPIHFLRLNPGE